jgi:hypothetical protein
MMKQNENVSPLWGLNLKNDLFANCTFFVRILREDFTAQPVLVANVSSKDIFRKAKQGQQRVFILLRRSFIIQNSTLR